MSMSVGTGTVYGVLLNDRATVERLQQSFGAPPYHAPPRAPVLYIKPRNTFAAEGALVAIPAGASVRIDGTVGAVIGRRASGVDASAALAHVVGFTIVSDITLPHESYYRPAVRLRCRDGFCPMSEPALPHGFDLARAEVSIAIDDTVVHHRRLSGLVRDLPRLMADVTAFMTLEAGDVLLLGPPDGAPLARAGARVRIDVAGLGALTHGLVTEAAAA